MRRKKSKYKHAVIGKKKYYFYKIVWQDPCGDSGHAEASEVKEPKPAVMISQAYIFAKDNKHVHIPCIFESLLDVLFYFFLLTHNFIFSILDIIHFGKTFLSENTACSES